MKAWKAQVRVCAESDMGKVGWGRTAPRQSLRPALTRKAPYARLPAFARFPSALQPVAVSFSVCMIVHRSVRRCSLGEAACAREEGALCRSTTVLRESLSPDGAPPPVADVTLAVAETVCGEPAERAQPPGRVMPRRGRGTAGTGGADCERQDHALCTGSAAVEGLLTRSDDSDHGFVRELLHGLRPLPPALEGSLMVAPQ